MGGSLSVTVTVKLHCAPSEVLQSTVVVPTGKEDPDGGEHVTGIALPQASRAAGEKATTAEHWPEAAEATIFGGQVMVVVGAPDGSYLKGEVIIAV